MLKSQALLHKVWLNATIDPHGYGLLIIHPAIMHEVEDFIVSMEELYGGCEMRRLFPYSLGEASRQRAEDVQSSVRNHPESSD